MITTFEGSHRPVPPGAKTTTRLREVYAWEDCTAPTFAHCSRARRAVLQSLSKTGRVSSNREV